MGIVENSAELKAETLGLMMGGRPVEEVIAEMKQRFIRIASSVAAVLLLAVGLIRLCHADPIEAFGYFCYGLFGSLNGFAEIFVKATPLILMGLGVSISFQTGFFNIGAEGQFYMAH